MRRLLIALLALSISARAATTTLTGTITDAQGNPLNGTLTMKLPVPAQDPTTNSAIQPTPVSFNVVNGQITGGAALYDLATIQPKNLWYSARAYDNANNLVFYGNYFVTGVSYNLGAATPTTINTSSISYINPVASFNMPLPPTWIGVTAATRSDAERHAMGTTFPITLEAPASFIQGGVYVMDIPSSATSTPNNNYNTLAAYGRSASTVDGTVALFADSLVGAAGVQQWSANFSMANCDGTTAGCANGHAFPTGNMVGLEQDVNVFTSATSTVPANADGISIVGASGAQASTAFNALHIRPAGIFGCPGAPSVCIPFKVGINFDDGAATTGITLGTNQTGNTQQSIPIVFTGRDGAGTARTVTVLSDQFGSFTVENGATIALQTSAAGKVVMSVGVANDGGGFKHLRQASCTTAASANATCTTGVSWTTAFADANYTTTVSLDAPTVAAGCNFISTNTKIASGVNVVIQNTPGASSACQGTINIIAVHD